MFTVLCCCRRALTGGSGNASTFSVGLNFTVGLYGGEAQVAVSELSQSNVTDINITLPSSLNVTVKLVRIGLTLHAGTFPLCASALFDVHVQVHDLASCHVVQTARTQTVWRVKTAGTRVWCVPLARHSATGSATRVRTRHVCCHGSNHEVLDHLRSDHSSLFKFDCIPRCFFVRLCLAESVINVIVIAAVSAGGGVVLIAAFFVWRGVKRWQRYHPRASPRGNLKGGMTVVTLDEVDGLLEGPVQVGIIDAHGHVGEGAAEVVIIGNDPAHFEAKPTRPGLGGTHPSGRRSNTYQPSMREPDLAPTASTQFQPLPASVPYHATAPSPDVDLLQFDVDDEVKGAPAQYDAEVDGVVEFAWPTAVPNIVSDGGDTDSGGGDDRHRDVGRSSAVTLSALGLDVSLGPTVSRPPRSARSRAASRTSVVDEDASNVPDLAVLDDEELALAREGIRSRGGSRANSPRSRGSWIEGGPDGRAPAAGPMVPSRPPSQMSNVSRGSRASVRSHATHGQVVPSDALDDAIEDVYSL